MFKKELPVFNLHVNGSEQIIDPNEDLQIYEGDLITEFSEQPAKFAFYGGLHTDALITLEQFKSTLKQYEAENEQEIRTRIQARFGSTERITEAKTEAEFARDIKWQELNSAIYEWERTVKRLEIIKEAFKQRAQMLWSIGATRRQEMVRLNLSSNSTEEQTYA